MKKRLLSVSLLVLTVSMMYAYAFNNTKEKQKRVGKMEQVMRNLPDSVFQDVKMEDLLDDEVYLKLACDGWSSREIATIMSIAVKDKKKAKAKSGYGFYAKQWLPVYGRALGDDPMYMSADTAMPSAMALSIAMTVSDDMLNKTWPKIVYTPDDRKKGRRNSGYFRPVEHKPSSGRIHWIVVHPENPDSLYVVPDGAGIFKTGDCGKSWTCITDNIPDRINRSRSTGYGIPVDPDDWNHVFAFMDNSSVYETRDGGDTWRRIQGATHKGFKRGYCFRDAEGTLKFIGASMNSSNRMYNQLWISEDTCKTWTSVSIPGEYKESLPSGVKGFWFQEVAFDANDRNRIYLPGSRSLLYFDDGAKSSVVNGQKVYNLKQMSFDVYNQDKTVERRPSDYPYSHTLFPMPADGVGFLVVSPYDSNEMWFACGRRNDNKTALYYSEDRGNTWITLQEPLNGIGSGSIFGNEMAYSWLGGFGVNFKDPNWIYGCSMSSAISSNGGRNFTEYSWINRIKSLQDDGRYYDVSNSRHNADNHCIVSHKSGRIFRGSDGGLFVKDVGINGGEWTNIGSNMGQMLYYNVRVNEFGDQAIIGNTQDIDVQTYRYGRWGNWRGYEGTESSFNPYTSVEYFSGSGGSLLDGMSFSSWHTARNYADVVTGSWYMLRTWSGSNSSTLYRIDDVGRSVIDLYKGLGAKVAEMGLARDKGRSTLFVRTTDYLYKYSTDGGNTFVPIMSGGQPMKFSNSRLAVDPNNSDFIYVGQNGGKVFRFDVNRGTFDVVGSGLPQINCDRLIFHEGSGDLYFVHYESGIYILEKGSDIWRFWTKGYNGSKFKDVDLNYTTQEMVIADYGRGVWVADLEHPADRYFENGFALKEYSHRNGRRTIGIDTRWTIPLYYYYQWTVNGETVNNPYQYLNRPLKAGDRVRLTLTLRESPDVKTVSAEYTVTETESRPIEHRQGNALYSSGDGRVDIGYMDWFFNDFTIDMWVCPMSDGVLLANRQKDQYNGKGAKGFLLYLEDGKLKFTYSPMNVLTQPTYEIPIEQNVTVVGPSMATGKWAHVAVTQKRNGEIRIYLNGELATTATRLYPDHTLNNSVCLSLFGDAHEQNTLQGSVDELKIWSRELSLEELRREMFSVNLSGSDGLVAYYNFNGESLGTDEEAFTGYRPVSRTRAEVSARRMTLPVSADYAVSQTLSVGETRFSSGEKALLTLTSSSISNVPAIVFAYDASQWSDDEDNLDKRYYEPAAVGYMVRTFGALQESDLVDISFHNASQPFADKNYRLYVADNTGDRTYWKFFGNLDSDAKTGALTLKQVPLQNIIDRKLLVVSMKPSIEVTVEGLTSDGRLIIYDENSRTYPMTARTVEGMPEPDGRFEIISESSILRPPSSFYFAHGAATGELKVDFDYLGTFNQTVKTCLRGPDDRMIPVSVDVVNRIAPSELGNAVAIPKGGLIVGNGADFAPLNNTNTLTIMGWVRIDNDFVLRGTSPIFFFRSEDVPGTALGIHLQDGMIRCHWNDEPWSYNMNTPLSITSKEIGKWIHLAMSVHPDGVDLYYNGMKYSVAHAMTKSKVVSSFMLGQNYVGDTWFSGAFEQVSLWNRSLSQEEIIKYMHERALMNAPGLVSYITMDETDENGNLCDSFSGASIREIEFVTHNALSVVPFNPLGCIANNTGTGVISMEFSGTARPGYITTFSGMPYNYLNRDYQTYLPLNKEYYTLHYHTHTTENRTDPILLHYRHGSVVAGDEIALGIRRLGAVEPFEIYAFSVASANGAVSFNVPASCLSYPSELMFFSSPASALRPANIELSFGEGIENGSLYTLSEEECEIPVLATVVSGSAEARVALVVKETQYARLDHEEIDMEKARNTFKIVIDRKKLDKLALNPVTVNLVGAESEELVLNVCFEPKVELKLKNGIDESNFVATRAIPTLDIEAELIEGYLDADVELEALSDMDMAMNTASGSLLLNKPVTARGMKYNPSGNTPLDAGWNLIGNPYLSNINLTKWQNVEYDAEAVTRFVYHTVGTDNVIAFDMTDYDGEQQIMPFQPYFVQVLKDDAQFTVTQIAKEKTLNRRTFDYYTAQELKAVQLRLYCDDVETDRTTVRWEADADSEFVLNEDAPKFWSHSDAANELYTVAADDTEVSINLVPEETKAVSVGLTVNTPGTMRLQVARFTGFDKQDNVYLVDKDTGNRILLTQGGESYEFTVADAGELNGRFELQRESFTGIDNVEQESGYRVYTGQQTCTVTGLHGNAQISIYAASGMLMMRHQVYTSDFTTGIHSGVYIVRIKENNKEYVTKIVVK